MKTTREPLSDENREKLFVRIKDENVSIHERADMVRILEWDDALRAALERAEKAEARYDECSRDLHHTTTERDAALAKLKDIEDMLACVWGTDVAADARDIGGRVKRTATGWTTGERITPRKELP